jgi:hypothetical protein
MGGLELPEAGGVAESHLSASGSAILRARQGHQAAQAKASRHSCLHRSGWSCLTLCSRLSNSAYRRAFPLVEQETSVNFLENQPLAEINTCRKDWHRRLENEGARPQSIDAARDSGGEFRWYLVPKSWVKLPALTGKR